MCKGYVGQGARPAGQYFECDFDWNEHARAVRHIVDAQQAEALALRHRLRGSLSHIEGAGQPWVLQVQLGGPFDASSAANYNSRDHPSISPEATTPGESVAPTPPDSLATRSFQDSTTRGVAAGVPPSNPCSARTHTSRLDGSSYRATAGDNGDAAAVGAAGHSSNRSGGGVYEGTRWEEFYRAHPSARFFKERRYLLLEFPELLDCEHVAEIGCGCGSSILPVLKANRAARTTCTAFMFRDTASSLQYFTAAWRYSAVSSPLLVLRDAAAAEGIAPSRICVFPADATDPGAAPAFEGIDADALLIMFTLSAVTPEQQHVMLTHAWRALRPGGRLLIRDHGLYDMVQLRIPAEQWVGPNLYKRGDGSVPKYEEARKGSAAFKGIYGAAQSLHVKTFPYASARHNPVPLQHIGNVFSSGLTELQELFLTLKKYEQTFSPEAKQLFQSTSMATDQAVKELEFRPTPAESSIAGYLVTGKFCENARVKHYRLSFLINAFKNACGLAGNKTMRLRTVLQNVQQALSNFSSGTFPVPRSSKEELSRVHGQILSLKFGLSSEQQLLVTQLRKLCAEVESRKHDFDVIETNLDNTMRNVLQQVHGKSVLEPEVLERELKLLQESIVEARAAGVTQLADILSLAVNSLQRLHAGHAENIESDDEALEGGAGDVDGDDDDEDPFFMPMPGAIKWAEASKFKELAKPLAPEQPAERQFMIVMEDDDSSSHTPSSITAVSAEPSANALVGTTPAKQMLATDSAESSPAAPAAAGSAEAAARVEPATADGSVDVPLMSLASTAAPATGDTPRSLVAQESLASARTQEPADAEEPAAVVTTPADASVAGDSPLVASPDAALDAGSADTAATQVTTPSPRKHSTKEAPPAPLLVPAEDKATVAKEGAPAAPPAESPTPEKLSDFVNFLNGENPGACMFHAQMRLSPEGCMKLANFLRSSARVRALSLSHNYLGDAGLRLICEGLRENKSVTALDLPDNNITDLGAAFLADAIKDNPSLTQLQLAYNKIGDQGAKALAQVIRTSHSLKKLGLAFNNIGKAGCQALTSAISSNQSLKHMQLLPGNPVEEKDAKALAKALKRNNKFSIKQLLGLKSDS
ncbi:hypothetical protein VOLCADRAFT_105335 [Volvox carteri f. nagariensis]|uniref:Methyltransferase type 12 domain-containing protein n=1 Tax=Volvox carteri f. nagariensis TaxID=3068 RepID=D8U076_VOLCA|nr:uncharacterized protein VOLCADRAFT_105335 [Volvox carteri f. nagariensis]EFJ46815.1 hypothetical protein VOLCADRAFT_105335 [Volvox carteri f. nagariensis]|eukprot:XP_002952024.1 hypothetical protein VOLCADRAFT_105335 [Volvox carteri f. nagariensis]